MRRQGGFERAVLEDMFEGSDRKGELSQWRSPGASASRRAADEHVLEDMSETGPVRLLPGSQGATGLAGEARGTVLEDMSEGRGEA